MLKSMIYSDKKLKILIFTLLYLWFLMPYGYSQENKTDKEIPLSLDDAIAFGFKNNRDIQIQEQDIKIARANIQEAQSEFLPKVDLAAGYTHNAAILTLGTPVASKKDIGIFSGYKNDNRLGVTVDESIYDGGASIVNFKQANLGLRVSEETLRAKKLDLEFEIKRLYYGFLLGLETKRITQELVNQAQSHYEDVKKKFEQGLSSKFDLLQSKIQVSKLMPELVRAGNAVDLIAAEIKKILGLKMQDSLKLEDKLLYSLIEIKEEEFLKQAYLNHPQMKLKALGIDINKWAIQMARSGWRPQVKAGLGYSYRSNDPGDMFNNRHSNWNAGFSVTIPLFDGFSTKAKVDQAASRYEQARLEKEDLVEQIMVDIRQACLDLKQAEAIINSSKDSVEEAREALRIAEISYNNGEGTNLDVLDTQVSLSQIEKNLTEAIYDYIMARAFLDRTIGQSYLQEAKNEKKS